MKRVCGWCKAEMGVVLDGKDDEIITHGMCDDCAAKMLWPHRPEMLEFLYELAAPVLVVGSTGNVNSANRMAREFLHKEQAEIEGLPGGIVFECIFAKLPEGCGKTIHCDGCTIRNTVMDTFTTGESHHEVPAGLSWGSTDNRVELQFYISTEKVDDVVLLRVDKVCND
jgi:hypothetical protein